MDNNMVTLQTTVDLAAVDTFVNTALALKANLSDIPAPYALPTASKLALGGIKVDGTSITITNGTISSSGGMPYSISSGSNSVVADFTSLTASNGYNTVVGDSKVKNFILVGTTISAVEQELLIFGGNRIPVNTDTTMYYSTEVVCRRVDAPNESSCFYIKGLAANFSGTTSDVGSLYEIRVASNTPNTYVDARVDATTNTLRIYATGEAAKIIKWVANVTTVEVAQ